MNELHGKVALVTGGGKGIGRAAVQALAEQDASIVVVDVDSDAAKAVAASVDGIAAVADIATPAGADEAFSAAKDAFGGVDVLVNSAGIQRYGSVVDTSEETWDLVLAINLKSMYLTAQRCVPSMIARGGGAIVNVASVQGFAAQRGVAAYSASKGGVIALTRAMAIDHAPAVRANCVCPGSVDTPMLRDAAALFSPDDPSKALKEWGEMHPMGRAARPEEIGNVIAFLAGPRSSFVTGAALVADGGLISVIGGT